MAYIKQILTLIVMVSLKNQSNLMWFDDDVMIVCPDIMCNTVLTSVETSWIPGQSTVMRANPITEPVPVLREVMQAVKP